MSKSVSDARTTRVQKVCTLWTHDDNFSRDDIVFNSEKFPEIPTTTGTLLQIVALDSNTAVRDFQSTTKGSQHDLHQAKEGVFARDTGANGLFKRSRRRCPRATVYNTSQKVNQVSISEFDSKKSSASATECR
ncbi:hypothetical protein SNOG_08691 [Parastagonospora nodorum SN15]|uniref:Uncharacterized protein n=1 Tax=Phaeosphaeria nodorum (strain SN15 / ATCC MYA-4574 / FGSC 10173) TaxID=321614 RepID=Q0UHS3_PHANO|nr:hypothetical protein SNOG_08691 [Parastagonospora nodorum SN15]EAT83859.1 hypothetical protein SNOG_08691 [Parastagonospora nodorum SN15]